MSDEKINNMRSPDEIMDEIRERNSIYRKDRDSGLTDSSAFTKFIQTRNKLYKEYDKSVKRLNQKERIRVHIQRCIIQKKAFERKLKSNRKDFDYSIVEEAIKNLDEQIKKYRSKLK